MTVRLAISPDIHPSVPGDADAIPAPLRDMLFGADLGTFVLLDAASITNLFEMLEQSELPFCCLFKDDAAEDIRDAAPYLVQLDPENTFTKRLFINDPDTPWHLWSQGPGVFIRAKTDLDALRAHFRKFTFLRDSGTGKWNVFRFHAPAIFRTMIAGSTLARDALMGPGVVAMGCPGLDDTWVTLTRDGEVEAGQSRTLDARHFHEPQIAAPYIQERREMRVREAVGYMRRECPGQVAALDDTALRLVVEAGFQRCDDTGVKAPAERLKYLLLIAAWGCHFEADPQRRPDLMDTNWMDAAGQLTGYRAMAPLLLRVDRWAALGARDMDKPKRLVTAMRRLFANTDLGQDPDALMREVTQIWPARTRALGPDTLKAGIKAALEVCHDLQLSPVDTRAYVCLTPYFGTYFAYDPLFAWAGAALANDGRSDDDRRLALGTGIIDYWNGLLGQVTP